MLRNAEIQSVAADAQKMGKCLCLLSHFCSFYSVRKCPLLFMAFDPFSPSDRWRTSTFLRCPECLQVIDFLSCFLRCNQRCPAFFRGIFLHRGAFAWQYRSSTDSMSLCCLITARTLESRSGSLWKHAHSTIVYGEVKLYCHTFQRNYQINSLSRVEGGPV